ncbi:MAG: O-antigen ligase family protein [Pseudomonadota bacterium]
MWHGTRRAPAIPAWAAFLVGVAVACPAVIPGVGDGNGPRTTDLLGLFSAGWLALAMLRLPELHRAIVGVLLVWAMTLPWIFIEIWSLGGTSDAPVQRLLLRWVLAGFSAYLIAVVADTPALRPRLLYGLMAGVLLSSLTLVHDDLTFSPEDVPIDQLVTLAIYNGKDIYDFVYRASGIFGHPNGAAGCVLLGVPLLIGAIQEGRAPRWSIAIALMLMAGTFYLTKSRGPLLVSAVLVGSWLWIEARGARLPLLLAGVAGVLGMVAVGGVAAGGGVLLNRFLDLNAISVNAGDRWWTIATSLDFMVRNPLGMASGYVAPLETATGTSATHSAYLELGLMGGIPLLAFVAVRLGRTAARLLGPWRPVEAWLACYLLGIFLFESYFLQVGIQLLTLWLVVSPLQRGREPSLPAAPAAARPPRKFAVPHAGSSAAMRKA